jgi:hypothetical protein
MKKLMMLGAVIGFSSGALFSLSQGAHWPDVLWRASIVCFASSFLFRWWGRMWLRSLRQAQLERLSANDLHQAPPANV